MLIWASTFYLCWARGSVNEIPISNEKQPGIWAKPISWSLARLKEIDFYFFFKAIDSHSCDWVLPQLQQGSRAFQAGSGWDHLSLELLPFPCQSCAHPRALLPCGVARQELQIPLLCQGHPGLAEPSQDRLGCEKGALHWAWMPGWEKPTSPAKVIIADPCLWGAAFTLRISTFHTRNLLSSLLVLLFTWGEEERRCFPSWFWQIFSYFCWALPIQAGSLKQPLLCFLLFCPLVNFSLSSTLTASLLAFPCHSCPLLSA